MRTKQRIPLVRVDIQARGKYPDSDQGLELPSKYHLLLLYLEQEVNKGKSIHDIIELLLRMMCLTHRKLVEFSFVANLFSVPLQKNVQLISGKSSGFFSTITSSGASHTDVCQFYVLFEKFGNFILRHTKNSPICRHRSDIISEILIRPWRPMSKKVIN